MLALVLMFVALFAISFLLGSIPWGVIISRVFFKKDIRQEGSGNIGATNAVRGLGLKGGALVFLLDVGKGAIAGAIGLFVWPPLVMNAMPSEAIAITGVLSGGVSDMAAVLHYVSAFCTTTTFLGCIAGHVFCPWLGFHGGKGISVGFGCELFMFGPIGALIDLVVFLAFVTTTRYVSLGSVMAAVACPFIGLWVWWGCWPAIVIICVAALLVIWAHRGNIARLAKGEERRIGSSHATSEGETR